MQSSFNLLLKESALPSPSRVGFMANEAYLPEGISAGPAVLVTVVREPRSRVLSEYLHEHSTGVTKASFGAWLNETSPGRLQAVDNGLVRRFCGGACWSEMTLGVAHLRRAVRNLLQFTLVLDVDGFTQGAALLKTILGWPNVRD